ncbi:MAG: acyl-CoA dehydrogenase family protein [Acidobacteriota bacterium]
MDEKQKKLLEELFFDTKGRKPSFGKLLYSGMLQPENVFPYPTVDEAEKKAVDDLLSELKSFCDEKIDPGKIDREGAIPDSVIEGLGDLGILGLTIPREFGGLGMSQYAYCRAMEQLASHCGSSALMVNAHQSVGLKALLLFGSEKQKARWLRPLATGKALAAFSLTEPNAGSDAAGIETRAEYDPQKKVFRINGRKQWTTNGSLAGFLTVMARTDEDEITAFIVTPDMAGFKVTAKALEKVGYRGTRTTNLQFDNLEVPEENILGTKGKGLRVCLTVLDYGRTTFGATCTGVAKYLVRRSEAYAVERRQFKQPLSSFLLVKQKLAEMAAIAYAMDASTYLTAGLIDAEEEDIMLETAILKVFASESLWKILYDTMQLFGGRSFFSNEPFERLMRDARINMIGEGSNDVLRVFIAAVGLREVGMAYKSLLQSMKHPSLAPGAFTRLARRLFRLFPKPEVPIQSSLLAPQAERLRSYIRRFSFSVLHLLAKHREAVVEEQLKLSRVAECAISLYTVAAVLSKADSRLHSGIIEGTAATQEIETARFYCDFALDKMDDALRLLFRHNRDDETGAFSDLITGN